MSAPTSGTPEWGKVLMAGGTDWDMIGRKPKPGEQREILPHLETFHVIREFADLKIVKAITGPNAAHSVFITDDGDAWTMGRNEKGQLGLGDNTPHVGGPVKVPTIYTNAGKKSTNVKFVTGAVGRHHTILVSDTGAVYAAGDNKMGQLGNSNHKDHTSFVHVTSLGKEKAIGVACGAEYTMVISDKGQLWAFGSPEFGQLGNKTNGQYLQQSNRLVHIPQASPVLVSGLQGKTIVEVDCGTNHTIARDSEGRVYSWGFGGYGRLGHSKQEDLWSPMPIDQFTGTNALTRATKIAAGSTFSMALDGQRQLWLWGKWKTTGDGGGGTPWMYPRTLYDLNGWAFKTINGGGVTLFALPMTEPCTVAWGQGALHCELGFGEGEARSATKPDKVRPMEGLTMLDVSCGLGHTLLLCKPGQEKIQDLPKWPVLDVEEHCIECLSAEDEDDMLLCDKCDSGTHLRCTVPRLQEVPDVDWFCQSCTRAREKNRTKQLDEGSKPAAGGAAAADGATAKAPTKRKAPAAKGGSKKSKANPASEDEDSE
ncbi:RCC1/BLIP-II protein [Linnemannia elongata AG-77]|uniref:RCC1/BLIP-II protein n=1 Tax=Linnemannia elongata AG-77 TaxID=1314771 RepID=A0A197JUM5_9FUNG|nr:RCC1/BLIP-II protein [Linnemannia elongata AG-77]